MSISNRVRQSHRWLSIVTLLTVVIVAALAAAPEEPAGWVYALPALPVLLLLATGLYLFVLPYARKRRGTTAPAAD